MYSCTVKNPILDWCFLLSCLFFSFVSLTRANHKATIRPGFQLYSCSFYCRVRKWVCYDVVISVSEVALECSLAMFKAMLNERDAESIIHLFYSLWLTVQAATDTLVMQCPAVLLCSVLLSVLLCMQCPVVCLAMQCPFVLLCSVLLSVLLCSVLFVLVCSPVVCLAMQCPVVCLARRCPIVLLCNVLFCLAMQCPVVCLAMQCPVVCLARQCPVVCLSIQCPVDCLVIQCPAVSATVRNTDRPLCQLGCCRSVALRPQKP